MKQIYSLILLLCGLLIFMTGCSSDKESNAEKDVQVASPDISDQKTDSKYYVPPKVLKTVEDTIEFVLNEAMIRDRYKDNSGLYENEFAYLTDEMGFDEYLTLGQIRFERFDWVNKIEINYLELHDHDSATVNVKVFLEYTSGDTASIDDDIIIYYSAGNWIKPTASVIKLQAEYDELIRAADEASQWEE